MLSGNFLFFLQLSQLCAQQWDWKGWQSFHQHLKLYLKANSARSRSDDAVLFKAFVFLPVEGQPMSPQLVQLHQHFFFQDFLTAARNAQPCALLCPGQLRVLMQMNVVGWSVNIAVCSDGECMEAACTVLLIYPPPCPLQAQLLLYHSW